MKHFMIGLMLVCVLLGLVACGPQTPTAVVTPIEQVKSTSQTQVQIMIDVGDEPIPPQHDILVQKEAVVFLLDLTKSQQNWCKDPNHLVERLPQFLTAALANSPAMQKKQLDVGVARFPKGKSSVEWIKPLADVTRVSWNMPPPEYSEGNQVSKPLEQLVDELVEKKYAKSTIILITDGECNGESNCRNDTELEKTLEALPESVNLIVVIESCEGQFPYEPAFDTWINADANSSRITVLGLKGARRENLQSLDYVTKLLSDTTLKEYLPTLMDGDIRQGILNTEVLIPVEAIAKHINVGGVMWPGHQAYATLKDADEEMKRAQPQAEPVFVFDTYTNSKLQNLTLNCDSNNDWGMYWVTVDEKVNVKANLTAVNPSLNGEIAIQIVSLAGEDDFKNLPYDFALVCNGQSSPLSKKTIQDLHSHPEQQLLFNCTPDPASNSLQISFVTDEGKILASVDVSVDWKPHYINFHTENGEKSKISYEFATWVLKNDPPQVYLVSKEKAVNIQDHCDLTPQLDRVVQDGETLDFGTYPVPLCGPDKKTVCWQAEDVNVVLYNFDYALFDEPCQYQRLIVQWDQHHDWDVVGCLFNEDGVFKTCQKNLFDYIHVEKGR